MGRVRRPNLLATAVSSRRAALPPLSLPPAPSTAAALENCPVVRPPQARSAAVAVADTSSFMGVQPNMKRKEVSTGGDAATVPPPTFRLYGVSPIWGGAHRNLLNILTQVECSSAGDKPSTAQLVWLPESGAEVLGLTITKPNAERVTSPYGKLISGDATSNPALLSFEAFQAHRIPLTLCGLLGSRDDSKGFQRLMIDAPSEFPSLYWGHAAEFAYAGATLLPGAHAVECVDLKGMPFKLYNAGQTSKPDFSKPETCVSYAPLLVPEMKYETLLALSYYWDVVLNRGRFKFCDEWIKDEAVKANRLKLKEDARCVKGRYNMWDVEDLKTMNKLCNDLWDGMKPK